MKMVRLVLEHQNIGIQNPDNKVGLQVKDSNSHRLIHGRRCSHYIYCDGKYNVDGEVEHAPDATGQTRI